MRRPWYTYGLMFVGGVALLAAAFRPMVGATSTDPGGWIAGPERRLYVRPGSPLAHAGGQTGDQFLDSEIVEVLQSGAEPTPRLGWTRGIPRSGEVRVRRGERRIQLSLRPAAPAPPVRIAWSLVGLLNVALVVLALALIWQRPRDGRAVHLGLVLMFAPVFAFPREPRLFALVLAAHFFAVFPQAAPGWSRWRAVRLYLPFLLFGFVGAGLWDEGRRRAAGMIFDLLAVGYSGYGLLRAAGRFPGASEAERPLLRTLAVAAAAILAAVVVGVVQPLWVISDQFVPANLAPALLFSGAVARLVFRLRVFEVRVIARRTLQYLLARWTLGTLFLVPGFLLVWRLGQLSVTREATQPREVLPYLIWMLLAALLLRRRRRVLENLDRRFFREIEAARSALLRLAVEVEGVTDPECVLSTLCAGIRGALRPTSVEAGPPERPVSPETELSIPLRRGESVLARLDLGPKESGEVYSSEERHLLEAAAAQAAVTLENLRLGAALLEQQRLELRARSAGVIAGAEEERRRLAADLHDQVLPELRQIAAEAERLRLGANGMEPELARLEADVRGTMHSVREVMEALRPSALDVLGLPDAVESYLREAAARRDPPPTVTVRRAPAAPPRLEPEQSLALYRICQEAVENLLRHSGATQAVLEIREEGGDLSLLLRDNGRGLEERSPAGSGRGMSTIRYRAELVGARVEWRPAEGGGTTFEVRMPLREAGRDGRRAEGPPEPPEENRKPV